MKCVIIEDEKPAQRLLENYIKKTGKLELVATYDSALEADIATVCSCDLLFLDIKLPQISGLAFLKTLPKKPEVIVTTAFPDYAVASFELEIVDYLLKPFSFERFLKAINRAGSLYKLKIKNTDNVNRKIIFIYSDKTFYRLEVIDILFVKGEGDYISIYTSRKKWLLNDTLKNWLTKLPPDQFIKVHQSYIVNRDRIDKLQGNVITIAGYDIPVSRNYKKVLIDLISREG